MAEIKTVIMFCCFCLASSARNNVCRTFEDYRWLHTNPNCWYNPDVGAHPKDVILRHGFPFEKHEVKTEDSYYVTLFRIPHNGTKSLKNPPIFLQHGIAVDSRSWLTRGAQSSVFILSNNGFDVWIGNARGTEYSSKHSKFTPMDPEFWDFDFHEIGIYEIPAVLDYIVGLTGQKVAYIGHSMGTIEAFVYASLKPAHADKRLKKIVALAPIANLRNLRSALAIVTPFRRQIMQFAVGGGLRGMGANLQGLLDLVHALCSSFPSMALCAHLLALGTGINPKEVVIADLPVFFSCYLQGFSLRTLNHFGQIMERNGRLQFYDYGYSKNSLFYGGGEAPDYPISQIRVPIDLIYGSGDFLAEPENVGAFYKQLKTKKTLREFGDYSHLDFQIGRTLPKLYNLVSQLVK